MPCVTKISRPSLPKVLNTISHTLYRKVEKCSYYGISSSLVLGRTTLSKPLIIGNLFHELLKLTESIELDSHESEILFDKQYTEVLEKYEELIREDGDVNLVNSFRYWSELSAVYDAVKRANTKSLKKNREVEIIDKISGIKGIIDEIGEDGGHLIEYKSLNQKEKLLRDEYIDQVHVYAHLINLKYGSYPSRITISGLFSEVDVELDISRTQLLVESMSRTFREINSKLDKDLISLCNYSQESCAVCEKRIVCPAISRDSLLHILDSNLSVAIFEVLPKPSKEGEKHVVGLGGCLVPNEEYLCVGNEQFALDENISYVAANVVFDFRNKKVLVAEKSKIYEFL